MRFYLRVINPAIAFVVLGLCFWAATYGDNKYSTWSIVSGGMATYFLAKGIFACCTLLITGRILIEVLARSEGSGNRGMGRRELVYCIALFGLTAGLLAGIFEWGVREPVEKTSASRVNPPEIQVVESHRVTESGEMRIGGTLKNTSAVDWLKADVSAKFFIGGKYCGECTGTSDALKAGAEALFVANCHDIANSNVHDSVTYTISVKAAPAGKGR